MKKSSECAMLKLMTRHTRRLLFLFFVLIFLIATPGVLFYAAGYSFDWQNGQVIKTGGFYFESLPSGANISINQKPNDSTPNFISRLEPGSYQVQISKDGFTTWQKTIMIEAQLTTEARNILLIPEKPTTNFVTEIASSTIEYFMTPGQKSAQAQAAKIATSTLNDFASQTVFQNGVYFLQKSNNLLFRTDLSGTTKEQISLEPLASSTLLYQIKVSSEQIAAFVPGGKLYLLDKNTKIFDFITDGVQGLEFSPDSEKLLYWTNHEIWVLWLKDVLAQPYRKASEQELIVRSSDKITQAIWLARTNEHIIYAVTNNQDQTQIKITELDNRDSRNTYDIAAFKNPEIYWNQDDNLLYVLSKGKLYSVDLFFQ